MAELNCLNLFNVQGRVALVTGGSSGLGLMISKVGALQFSSPSSSLEESCYFMTNTEKAKMTIPL
jgi:hypothetical protein